MKKSKLLVLTALIVVFMLSFGLFTGCNLQPGDLSQSKPTEEISETDTTPDTEQPSEQPSESDSQSTAKSGCGSNMGGSTMLLAFVLLAFAISFTAIKRKI